MDSNPAYFEKLSQKIKQIIDDYRQKRISEEDKLANAKEIQQTLKIGNKDDVKNYPDTIQNNVFAKIIYDNIDDYFAELPKASLAEVKIDFSLKTEHIFTTFNQRPDCRTSTDIQNQINSQIQDLLWELEDNFAINFKIDDILEKLRGIWISNL